MSDSAPSPGPPEPEVIKAECSDCGGVRNCDVRGKHLSSYYEGEFSGHTSWRILECRGCENVFVQTNATNSEDYEHFREEDGSEGIQSIETIRYWPALSKRQRPVWMSEYGIADAEPLAVDTLHRALVELYGALDADLRMLAGIGIRTAYDVASELLGIDAELTFVDKLNALVTGNSITSLDRSRLETMVDAGSASAHRGWRPSPQELEVMMNTLEHFIYEAFVAPGRRAKLDAEAEKMKGSVTPRRPKKRRLDVD